MWDSTALAPQLPTNKADLFLRRLKSETWATHSTFVHALFICLAGPQRIDTSMKSCEEK
jgi:hypothetical protein